MVVDSRYKADKVQKEADWLLVATKEAHKIAAFAPMNTRPMVLKLESALWVEVQVV